MTRVAARLDDRDVHAATAHVVCGELREAGAYAPPLVVGIDADDLDDAHALVERIQSDGDEADRSCAVDCDVDVALVVQADRADGRFLARPPVGM